MSDQNCQMPVPPSVSSPERLKFAPRVWEATPEYRLQNSLCRGYAPEQAEAVRRALASVLTAERQSGKRSDAFAVARTLKSVWADAPTLQAALLVDSIPDSNRLTAEFGTQVAEWVAKVKRLEQLVCPETYAAPSDQAKSKDQEVEMWRRLFLAVANDVRPLLIVLARRLETLRQVVARKEPEGNTPPTLARETLAVHAPLASRLGVHRLKWELEDLAFRHLEPEAYYHLAARLASTRASRESYINDFIAHLKTGLHHAGISAKVHGRPKHLFSIWKKMQRKQLDFSGLFDLNAVRVIVGDVPACYRVLALVHDRWEPIPEEYDDYIARPKDNGYQSLHTVIEGPQGLPVEIQIRTDAMHTLAEYGMAAHWRYKEGGRHDATLEHTVAALRRSLQTGAKGEDWFTGRIFVLSPRHRVICLPTGATPVDFAYAIHTQVGHRCRGARVDGRIVPLDYRLRTGQRVEILTAKSGGPNRSWLDQIRTGRARHRIRQWFKRQEAENHLRLGRQRLEREQRRLGLKEIDWPAILRRFRFRKPEEVWIAAGRGEISRGQVATALRGSISPPPPSVDPKPSAGAGPCARSNSRQSQGIAPTLFVQGEPNLLTRLARCCQPSPGDPVIGYLTVQHRITIHRRDCPNIVHLPEARRERLVEAAWE